MSDLPDIDTSQVSFVAFWNAIDQGGVQSISPDEATSANRLNSTTLYDNGFSGQYNAIVGGRTLDVRVKSDGWIIASMDRTDNFQTDSDFQVVNGQYDVVRWDSPPNSANLNTNVLERAINGLRTELSNSGSMTYNAADVGLYNYAYPDGTTTTCLSAGDAYDGSNDDRTAYHHSDRYGFVYTDSTNRLYHTITAAIDMNNAIGGFGASRIRYEETDTTLCNTSRESGAGSDERSYGSIDLIANGQASSAGQEYTMLSELGETYSSGDQANGSDTVLMVWN